MARRRLGVVMVPTAMPTAERLRQAGGAFNIGGDRRSGKVFRMMDTPLEQIYSENKLSNLQYESLRKLRMHWYLGQLSGNPQSADLNRVTVPEWHGASRSEAELMHRESFAQGYRALQKLERFVVSAVVLTEISLAMTGAAMGYRSPYRARSAALLLLQSGADNVAHAYRRLP